MSNPAGPARPDTPDFDPPDFDDGFRTQLDALFRWRRDVRHFRTDPVPADQVDALLQRASFAPSVGLSEPWRFVMVETESRREAIRKDFERCNADALAVQGAAQGNDRAAAYARLKLSGMREAPVQFAVFSETDPEQGHGLGRMTMPETTAYSTVMAVHTIWLAARAAGLGLGWVSILDPAAVSEILDIPPEWHFIGYFCLGYPARNDDRPELEREGWERRRPAGREPLRR